jgi:hypothetical protein
MLFTFTVVLVGYLPAAPGLALQRLSLAPLQGVAATSGEVAVTTHALLEHELKKARERAQKRTGEGVGDQLDRPARDTRIN